MKIQVNSAPINKCYSKIFNEKKKEKNVHPNNHTLAGTLWKVNKSTVHCEKIGVTFNFFSLPSIMKYVMCVKAAKKKQKLIYTKKNCVNFQRTVTSMILVRWCVRARAPRHRGMRIGRPKAVSSLYTKPTDGRSDRIYACMCVCRCCVRLSFLFKWPTDLLTRLLK